MSANKTSNSGKTAVTIIGIIMLLAIAVQVGIALFGDWFEADKTVMKNTVTAQQTLKNALFITFGDLGRLEVRQDCSVRAYISKRNYLQIPYPDRNEAIRTVGKAWCEDKKIVSWRLPKVLLRDIETGEKLGSYGCLTGRVSKK